MSTFFRKIPFLVLIAVSLFSATGCGYNAIQIADEQVNAAWAEVLNQYQRRYDLVPNIVKIAKATATHEKEVLIGVTEARARVGSIQATPELIKDPQAFGKFQAAQGELSSALQRLMVVMENYPQLKAQETYRDLMAEYSGTENRLAVARNRYIKAVQEYNVTIRMFPKNLTAMAFGYTVKPNFSVENESEIKKRPEIDL